MPDLDGFMTIREVQLELEVERLRRKVAQLERHAQVSPGAIAFVDTHKVCLPEISPRRAYEMVAFAEAEPDQSRALVRVRAEAYPRGKIIQVAEYVSEGLLRTHYRPEEAMMDCYWRALSQVARNST